MLSAESEVRTSGASAEAPLSQTERERLQVAHTEQITRRQ